MLSVETASLELTELLLPFIGMLLMLIITLLIKDFAVKLAKGIAFNLNKSFNEGDHVIVDGEHATIVKIGIGFTVFGVHKEDKTYCWRYISNDRIPFIKLEKVIHKSTNNEG